MQGYYRPGDMVGRKPVNINNPQRTFRALDENGCDKGHGVGIVIEEKQYGDYFSNVVARNDLQIYGPEAAKGLSHFVRVYWQGTEKEELIRKKNVKRIAVVDRQISSINSESDESEED